MENEDPDVKYERIPEADNTIMSPKTIKTPAEPSNKLYAAVGLENIFLFATADSFFI
jgi:hypothetical protein